MGQYINVGEENSTSIDLYYEDHGSGKPVVLIHGWPLNGASWEKQVPALLDAGYRVITYDRRGFGKSSKPSSGYDYPTFAKDLDKILKELDLFDVSLVGFSMGGGEVAHYLGVHGFERVNKAVFIAAITPFLLKTIDNQSGVDGTVFDEFKKLIAQDRLAFMTTFLSEFYNVDELKGSKVSDEVVKNSWNVASQASPIGTLECVNAWLTDFREDIKRISIPTLVIHGEKDRIAPVKSTGRIMPHLLKHCKLVEVKDAPHGLNWTHSEEVNQEILKFLE